MPHPVAAQVYPGMAEPRCHIPPGKDQAGGPVAPTTIAARQPA